MANDVTHVSTVPARLDSLQEVFDEPHPVNDARMRTSVPDSEKAHRSDPPRPPGWSLHRPRRSRWHPRPRRPAVEHLQADARQQRLDRDRRARAQPRQVDQSIAVPDRRCRPLAPAIGGSLRTPDGCAHRPTLDTQGPRPARPGRRTSSPSRTCRAHSTRRPDRARSRHEDSMPTPAAAAQDPQTTATA
jgi:hypothetical protein